MLRITTLLLLLGTGIVAAREVPSETYVIQAAQDGREAIVKIPVGAVSAFSADRAVALTDYADPKVEAMRLSGDVRIHVIGAPAPIQIRADRIVLELTADEAPTHLAGGNVGVHPGHRVQSAQMIRRCRPSWATSCSPNRRPRALSRSKLIASSGLSGRSPACSGSEIR